jgi:hypothetical protein
MSVSIAQIFYPIIAILFGPVLFPFGILHLLTNRIYASKYKNKDLLLSMVLILVGCIGFISLIMSCFFFADYIIKFFENDSQYISYKTFCEFIIGIYFSMISIGIIIINNLCFEIVYKLFSTYFF